MSRVSFFVILLLIAGSNMHAQSITRSMLIGNWTQYVIDDTAAYFAIEDNDKADSTVRVVAFPITNSFELNSDSTFSFYADWMIDGVLEGKWRVQGDTLRLHYENSDSTMQDERYTVRWIGEGRFEWKRTAAPGHKAPAMPYSFIERREY